MKYKANLFRNGGPRYVRCYDDGESIDRYTAVFTGHYRKKTGGAFWYLAMNAAPYHPQGFGLRGESENRPIDRPTYGHLGKKIAFDTLPDDCRHLVLKDYCDLWDSSPPPRGCKGRFEPTAEGVQVMTKIEERDDGRDQYPTTAQLTAKAEARGWRRGTKLYYGEFPATVIRHYYEDMWEVLVPGGEICVSGSSLSPAKANSTP